MADKENIAAEERPWQTPFKRSPSDVAHDRIKGPYGPEDAITPGPALGAGEGLVADANRVQDTADAVEAELKRRETFSEVEQDEAKARDSLARRLLDQPSAGTLNTAERVDSEDIKERLDNEVPAVGGNPAANTNAEGADPGDHREIESQRFAREIAQAKSDAGDNEPVLGPDFSKLESDEESDKKERDAAVSVSESPRKQRDEISDSLEASEDAADVQGKAESGDSQADKRSGFGPAYGRGE